MLEGILTRVASVVLCFSFISLGIFTYTEATGTHFAPTPRDSRLPEPEFIPPEKLLSLTLGEDNEPPVKELHATSEIFSEEDVHCLAKNIFFESRDQDLVGQLMVALVTIERKNATKRYPDTICEVVYARKQFSWTNSGDRDPDLDNPIERDAWETAKTVAKFSLIIDTQKPLLNVTHYHTLSVKPKWSKSKELKEAYVVGDHVFYEERRI